jgi:hypothetical protein
LDKYKFLYILSFIVEEKPDFGVRMIQVWPYLGLLLTVFISLVSYSFPAELQFLHQWGQTYLCCSNNHKNTQAHNGLIQQKFYSFKVYCRLCINCQRNILHALVLLSRLKRGASCLWEAEESHIIVDIGHNIPLTEWYMIEMISAKWLC